MDNRRDRPTFTGLRKKLESMIEDAQVSLPSAYHS